MDLERKHIVNKMQSHFTYIIYDSFDRTYVGYTVQQERRIKQHNGLLSGGARFTTRHATSTLEPDHWKYLLIISSCEMTKNIALSLEWSLKYPNNKRPQRFRTPEARIRSLPLVFNNPKFAHIKCFTIHIKTENTHLIQLIQSALANLPNVQII